MKFELSVDLDNHSFEENPEELAYILEDIAKVLRKSQFQRIALELPLVKGSVSVFDSGGQDVGLWQFLKKDEE